MSTSTDTQHDLVVEKESARTAPPPMYQVVLLNDDYTPMEFVVGVLQKFFSKSEEEATRIMLQVHNEGRGVCGVYPRDIAATRVAQVAQYARAKQHPLQCVMEPL
ncbi:MAG TPA: ATP-dependent Clp protease adapter ClpS [Bordetella sp.]|nr:ATP-dependent Clp protease adapter ClpS [Bordetella sp.]